jgi:hypothetical protein
MIFTMTLYKIIDLGDIYISFYRYKNKSPKERQGAFPQNRFSVRSGNSPKT